MRQHTYGESDSDKVNTLTVEFFINFSRSEGKRAPGATDGHVEKKTIRCRNPILKTQHSGCFSAAGGTCRPYRLAETGQEDMPELIYSLWWKNGGKKKKTTWNELKNTERVARVKREMNQQAGFSAYWVTRRHKHSTCTRNSITLLVQTIYWPGTQIQQWIQWLKGTDAAAAIWFEILTLWDNRGNGAIAP